MKLGHNVPHKVGREGSFFKSFSWQIDDNLLEAVLHGRLISDHVKGGGVSQIHFSVIIFIFAIMKLYTLEDKSLTKIMEGFILEVNS